MAKCTSFCDRLLYIVSNRCILWDDCASAAASWGPLTVSSGYGTSHWAETVQMQMLRRRLWRLCFDDEALSLEVPLLCRRQPRWLNRRIDRTDLLDTTATTQNHPEESAEKKGEVQSISHCRRKTSKTAPKPILLPHSKGVVKSRPHLAGSVSFDLFHEHWGLIEIDCGGRYSVCSL